MIQNLNNEKASLMATINNLKSQKYKQIKKNINKSKIF